MKNLFLLALNEYGFGLQLANKTIEIILETKTKYILKNKRELYKKEIGIIKSFHSRHYVYYEKQSQRNYYSAELKEYVRQQFLTKITYYQDRLSLLQNDHIDIYLPEKELIPIGHFIDCQQRNSGKKI
ncbi:MAG: hypothetical protein JXB50_14325 [Spirochaetes bacterium]|nr:hypothetical protein [Spirochaetota bacterium]